MIACLDCGAPSGPLCPACARVAHANGLAADERVAMLRGQPSLFDPDGDSDSDSDTGAPELTQQFWGVRLLRTGNVAGPFKTREGAEDAQAHYANTRPEGNGAGRIVTCRATAWEDA